MQDDEFNHFKIIIDIKPNNKCFDSKVEKYSAYYRCSSEKSKWDKITYQSNIIVITGTRYKEFEDKINHISSDALFTVKSTQHFDILKALIYYWYTWCGFKINSIRMDINGEPGTPIKDEELCQNFEKDCNLKLDDLVLEKVLEQKSDNAFITALTYQICGFNNNSFSDTWRCFNTIYCAVEGTDKDKEAMDKLMDKDETFIEGNEELMQASRSFVKNLQDSRIFRWTTVDNKNLDAFKALTEIDKMKDMKLLSKLSGVAKMILDSFNEESQQEKKTYKSIHKLANHADETQDFDCLRLAVNYGRYLRNKYFHGDYKHQMVLNSNYIGEELTKLNNIIQQLNNILLFQHQDDLLKK